MDALRVPVAGYVAAEICPEARRVVESWLPEVMHVEDVTSIEENDVSEWALTYPGVVAVILGAGPPARESQG